MARYTMRWPVALSPRDVEKIKQAAQYLDVTSSEFMRMAIREKLSRVMPATPRPRARQHERAQHVAA